MTIRKSLLQSDVEEYLHWRHVNPHIKGGENYLRRLRQSLGESLSEQPDACADCGSPLIEVCSGLEKGCDAEKAGRCFHWKELANIAETIHYPKCWDTIAYPTVYDALSEMAGCVGCSECKYAGKNPDADQRPTKRESVEESGWVIELAASEPCDPQYWVGSSLWQRDHLKAIRFARKQDAEQAAFMMLDGMNIRICEHGWSS